MVNNYTGEFDKLIVLSLFFFFFFDPRLTLFRRMCYCARSLGCKKARERERKRKVERCLVKVSLSSLNRFTRWHSTWLCKYCNQLHISRDTARYTCTSIMMEYGMVHKPRSLTSLRHLSLVSQQLTLQVDFIFFFSFLAHVFIAHE